MRFFYCNTKVGHTDNSNPYSKITYRTGQKVDNDPLKAEVGGSGTTVPREHYGTGQDDKYTSGVAKGTTEKLPDGKDSKLETLHTRISDQVNDGRVKTREAFFRQAFYTDFCKRYGKSAWDTAVAKVRERFNIGSTKEAEEKLWKLIYGFSNNVSENSGYSKKHYELEPSQISGNKDVNGSKIFEEGEWKLGSQLCIPMRDGQIDLDEIITPNKPRVVDPNYSAAPIRIKPVYYGDPKLARTLSNMKTAEEALQNFPFQQAVNKSGQSLPKDMKVSHIDIAMEGGEFVIKVHCMPRVDTQANYGGSWDTYELRGEAATKYLEEHEMPTNPRRSIGNEARHTVGLVKKNPGSKSAAATFFETEYSKSSRSYADLMAKYSKLKPVQVNDKKEVIAQLEQEKTRTKATLLAFRAKSPEAYAMLRERILNEARDVNSRMQIAASSDRTVAISPEDQAKLDMAKLVAGENS